MARLTEEMVIARSKQSDLSSIKKFNCWGAELVDVSLLRRMPNVEVLAFSLNKIRRLEDFANCRRLKELYVRKNNIEDLREIRHLRGLDSLINLWLDENPCTGHANYRMTVLRTLPGLEVLDNVPVMPDEVQEAQRRGDYIADSDDEGYPQQEPVHPVHSPRQRSVESSPERERYDRNRSTNHEQPQQCPLSGDSADEYIESNQEDHSTINHTQQHRAHDNGDRYEQPPPPPNHNMTRSYYENRAPQPAMPLRHSMSTQSVKEYGIQHRPQTSPPTPRANDRNERYYEQPANPRCSGDCERENSSVCDSERERDRDRAEAMRERDGYTRAVMCERGGFNRRPANRNSNLLSAMLCLIKELDYQSLEVAEMAVRCRMDELADSQ